MVKNSDLRNIFGENLKSLRLNRQLTQAQLAEQVFVEPKHISCIENGLSFPSAELLARFADVFQIKPYELFLFEKKPVIKTLKEEIINILEKTNDDNIEKIYLYTKFVTAHVS